MAEMHQMQQSPHHSTQSSSCNSTEKRTELVFISKYHTFGIFINVREIPYMLSPHCINIFRIISPCCPHSFPCLSFSEAANLYNVKIQEGSKIVKHGRELFHMPSTSFFSFILWLCADVINTKGMNLPRESILTVSYFKEH